MNHVKLIIFIIFTIISAPKAFAGSSCERLLGSCDYYDCLSADLRCSSENYLQAFGGYYCRLFVDENERFSRHGQEFLSRVRPCLQQELEEQRDQLSCETVETAALKHHVTCYVESGFCELGASDRIILGRFIWRPIANERKFRQTGFAIERACLEKRAGLRTDL